MQIFDRLARYASRFNDEILLIYNHVFRLRSLIISYSKIIEQLNHERSRLEDAIDHLNHISTKQNNRMVDLEQEIRVNAVENQRLNAQMKAMESSLVEDSALLAAARKERDRAVVALVQVSRVKRTDDATHRQVGSASRQAVLIVLTTISQFPHLRALCNNVQFRGRYNPIVLGFVALENTDIAAFCKDSGVLLFNSEFREVTSDTKSVDLAVAEPDVPLDSGFSRAELMDEQTPAALSALVSEIRRQSKTADGCHRLLARTQVSLVVLFEENAAYRTGIVVSAARSHFIPTVIMPFTIGDELEAAEAYFDNPDYWPTSNVFNELVAKACPRWSYVHRDKVLLRSRGILALADEAMGVAPPMPWVMNSSRASAIAVESPAMLDLYKSAGLPSDQLEAVGSMIDDVIFAATQRADEVRSALGLDRSKPVLLCSFPPNQLDGVIRQTEWESFEELLDFWANELLGLSGWQVVIKPHPSLARPFVQRLRDSGLKVTDRDTAELIPICDLYNACVSSTIRWALACGKPVLNYDAFSYRYRDFTKEGAVVTVDTRDDFRAALERLTQDAMFLKTQTEAAQAAAPRWGRIDGQAGTRLFGLFDKLTGRVRP